MKLFQNEEFQKASHSKFLALFVCLNMLASIYEKRIIGVLEYCQKSKEVWIKTGNRVIDVIAYMWIGVVVFTALPYMNEVLDYLLFSPVFTFSMLWSLLKFMAIIYVATTPARKWLQMSNIIKNNKYNPFVFKIYHKYIGYKKPQYQI